MKWGMVGVRYSVFVHAEGHWKCYNQATMDVSGVAMLWLAWESLL